jgi:hypothetical protein
VSSWAVKRITQGVAVVIGVALLLVIGRYSWARVDALLGHRDLMNYLESRRAYAARSVEELATLPAELRESSGLVVSRSQPGVLWSHNDSGDGPNLYAIDQQGHLIATVPVEGAVARDWEDIAAGPCPAALLTGADRVDPGCLYIADTGNNNIVREIVTIYVVIEPRLGKAGTPPPIVPAMSVRFRFPDRPYDCEAIAVRPDGDVTLVTKGQTGRADFYGISAQAFAQALASGEVVTAQFRGNTGIDPNARISRLVTGAAISPDGMTLAVRTYNEIFFYATDEGHRWRDLMRPCLLGDAEPQGEGIDYLDADTFLLTSETRGRAGTIHRVRC